MKQRALRTLTGVACATLAAVALACSESSGPKPMFSVTGMTPSSGPLTGGTTVTITGPDFPATIDSVRVGTGRLGSVVRVSATRITGTTPARDAPGAVDVTVYGAGSGTGTCARCFTYLDAGNVVVRGVIPSYGALAGGTNVYIIGDFPVGTYSTYSVRIGTSLLSNVAYQGSWGLLNGTTPAGITPGPVDVTLNDGIHYGTCFACFTYHSTAGFAHYTVTPLEIGSDSSVAVDISDSGAVVGRVWSAATGWRGRLWPALGSALDLDTLLPLAINNAGTVLGCLGTFSTGQEVVWDSGATQALHGPGNAAVQCGHASDLNDGRQVPLSLSSGVYLWQNDSLTPLNAGGCGVMALGRMNDRGEVAATLNCTGGSGAVLSTAAPRYLFGHRYAGGAAAVAVNHSGAAVGYGEWIMGVARGGELSGVGPLPFVPTDINNSLQIVGAGFIWQDSAEATLSSRLVDPAWQISNAVAINNRGQIAAYGVNTTTGLRGAVRLDPIASTSGSAATRRH